MNKAYKVVFNKLRGTMMVVNEATSSIQKKGTKTALSVALIGCLCVSGLSSVSAATYVQGQGSDITVTADDIKSSEDYRVLGGWSDWSNEAAAAKLGNTVTVESGNWDMVVGGHYSKVTGTSLDNPTQPSVESTNIIINGGSVRFVVGGTGGSDNAYIEHINQNAVTSVTINGGTFGRKGEVGNATELIVLGGDLMKHSGDLYGADINRYGESHIGTTNIIISDGTFDSAIVGGSAAIVYYGNANNGNKVVVDKTNITITGGTFNHGVIAGGLASGHKTYSTVNEANLTVEKTDKPLVFNNGIYAGGVLRNDGYGNPTDSGVTVGQSNIRIVGADVGDIYGTHAQLVGIDGTPNKVKEWIYSPLAVGDALLYVKTNLTLSNASAKKVQLGTDSSLTVEGTASIQELKLNKNAQIKGSGGVLTVGSAVLDGAITLDGTLTLTKGINGSGATLVVNKEASLTVNGNLTLGGYIQNEGSVEFSDGSTVSLVLTNDMISNGEYDLVHNTNTGSVTWNTVSFENALYDIAWIGETGTVSIKQKSAESLVESLPVTSQQAGTIAAVLPTATAPATPELGQIANAIRSAAREEIAQIAEDLAPSTAPVVSSISQGVNNAIAGVANARLAANRAAGDVFTGGSAWAQMIYNSADQDATKKTAELESDTYGITVGVDGKIGDNLTIGAGFGVTKTDAESGTRDIDVDSYSLFGYTEYNADNGWFVNGMATAIRGRYEETKVPAGIKLTAKYQTTVLGAGVATGYHFENGISPEVGLRYLRTHQGSYNDGAQKIHTDGTNLLTASLGAKYEKAFEQGDWLIKPTARVAATYDVVSDDTESAIRVIGGGQYHVISEHQKRAAFEAGLGLEASNGDWDFSVAYNGEFRSHFKSHTGMIKAKYNF